MLKILGIVVAVGIAGVLVAAALRPDTFRVQRSVRIDAPVAAVHPLINNMAHMNSWNPFVQRDPQIRGTYRGPAEGPGAAYDFQGNREVGAGSVEITQSSPDKITMKLDTREPMEGHHVVEFLLAARGDATEVTWAMHGASPYISKLVGLVLDMDKMVGGAFDSGLAQLKAKAEKRT